jgi:hypothetical protein
LYKDAIVDFSNLIKLNHKDGKAYFFRGMSYLKLKNKKQACADLTKSSELGYVDANAELTKNCKSPKKSKNKR